MPERTQGLFIFRKRRAQYELAIGLLFGIAISALVGLFASQRAVLQRSEPPKQSDSAANRSEKDHAERLDWYNWTGDPIAVFTGLLTGFNGPLFVSTIALWLATRKTAKISERALTELERAYIFVETIGSNLNFYLDPTAGWNPERRGPNFTFSGVNYGRTPGNIDRAFICFEVLDRIPAEPDETIATTGHEDAESAEIIIGPNRRFTFPPMRCKTAFMREHAQSIRTRAANLYCYGFFTYFAIFMKPHPPSSAADTKSGSMHGCTKAGDSEIPAIRANPACRSQR